MLLQQNVPKFKRLLLEIIDMNKKILIQANNLDTVVDVFMYIYMHQGCGKQDIADYCGFSLRQVDYYTSACIYLDLIDGKWNPTELAKDIFENSPAEITDKVYCRIKDDKIIGQVYQMIDNNPDEYPTDFALELVREFFPGYSESVYKRRSDNMIKWCIKVRKYLNTK